jgi:hypothetical protein
MKITDVTLTLFAWDDIPPTTYGAHSRFSGSSALGLLRIITDEGIEGNAFLGSASNSATTDGQGLITHLKPMLMGRNPLHRRRRRGAVGSLGQIHGPADPSAARHLSRIGAGLCQFRRPVVADRICRGGGALQGKRLGRLQDPSADAVEAGHQGLRGGAPRRRRLHHHARLDLELRLSGGGARRPRRRGDGLLLVRGSARRPGHLQLCEAEATALDPDHGHRVSHHRPRFLPALDHAAGDRLFARRRCRQRRPSA